jgi:hypothetical protein
LRQRVALVATLARLYVGVVLIDRERECRGHRRRIVGVVYDHMCQQQCDQRIGYAAGLRPGNMSQIGARSAYLALRDFDPANVSCGSIASFWPSADYFRSSPGNGHRQRRSACLESAKAGRTDCPTIAMNAGEFGRTNQSGRHVL